MENGQKEQEKNHEETARFQIVTLLSTLARE
jgi:hypothetical protein